MDGLVSEADWSVVSLESGACGSLICMHRCQACGHMGPHAAVLCYAEPGVGTCHSNVDQRVIADISGNNESETECFDEQLLFKSC